MLLKCPEMVGREVCGAPIRGIAAIRGGNMNLYICKVGHKTVLEQPRSKHETETAKPVEPDETEPETAQKPNPRPDTT